MPASLEVDRIMVEVMKVLPSELSASRQGFAGAMGAR